jgi:hypothetical protein
MSTYSFVTLPARVHDAVRDVTVCNDRPKFSVASELSCKAFKPRSSRAK